MKIVVIGGSGLIGSRVVAGLRVLGHEVVAASPNTGVDAVTGEGLAEALAGATVVVDVANSPSFEDEAVMAFFRTAGVNLLAAEQAAGVQHHVALSVVGTERLPNSGYFRAKLVQEELIKGAATPWTILRATQFYPFVAGIIQAGSVGDEIHVSSALVQPVAPDDVAAALVEIALSEPLNDTVEIAGPQTIRIDTFAQDYLTVQEDRRKVVGRPDALYFGTVLEERSLTPGPDHRLGQISFAEWMSGTV